MITEIWTLFQVQIISHPWRLTCSLCVNIIKQLETVSTYRLYLASVGELARELGGNKKKKMSTDRNSSTSNGSGSRKRNRPHDVDEEESSNGLPSVQSPSSSRSLPPPSSSSKSSSLKSSKSMSTSLKRSGLCVFFFQCLWFFFHVNVILCGLIINMCVVLLLICVWFC